MHHTGETASLAGRTLLAVFAHPDDESLACGGTLARFSDAGVRVVLLCASQGERGFVSDPSLVPDGDSLGSVRAGELRAAAKVLGVADLLLFHHQDGNLRWIDAPALDDEIVSAIVQYKPDAVITFGEDGLYWHIDHIGIHERTMDAVLSLGEAGPPLYYVTMKRGDMRRLIDAAVAEGWSPPASGFWSIVPDAFGLHAAPPTVTVDVRPWVPRKLAALACHKTQMGSPNPFSIVGDTEARECLGFEYFRRAPIPGLPHRLLEQLGEAVIMT